MAEVPIDGIVILARYCTLSFLERNVPFPGEQYCFTCTCKAAWDAHVVLSHMYMSYRLTCTCKTILFTGERNVPFWERQSTIPGKGNNAVYGHFRYRKGRVIIFLTIRIWIYLRSALNSIVNHWFALLTKFLLPVTLTEIESISNTHYTN